MIPPLPQLLKNQQTSPSPAKRRTLPRSIIIGIAIILLMGASATTGYFLGKPPKNVVIPVSLNEKQPEPTPTFTLPIIDSWQKYVSPSATFSFEYPAGWNVENNGSDGVLVSSLPDEKQNYYAFHIQDNGILTSNKTNNATIHVLQQMLDFEKEEKIRCQQAQTIGEPCTPLTPGLTENYQGPAGYLFRNPPASVVEIKPYFPSPGQGFAVNSYTLIKDYRKYKITLVAPKQSYRSGNPHKLDENHPLIHIVNSLEFK